MNCKHLLTAFILACAPMLAAAGSPSPRTVNAVFTVNSVADSVDVSPGDGICQDASGQCSLRAAIMEANALAGPDTIIFDPITDGQPILLQLHGAGEDAAATGDLDITEGLTITGNGTGNTIIDGDAADRVFDINPVSGTNITVEIDDLTVQGGDVPDYGGGIRANHSTLVMNGDLIQGNLAEDLINSSFGGGIYAVSSTVTFDHTTIDSNTASAGQRAAGGGIALGGSSTLNVLDGSVISNNTASGNLNDSDGGGIYLMAGNVLTIDSSAVRQNLAVDTYANEPAYGGGIEMTTSSYSITNSEISHNIAHGDVFAFGGGIDSEYTSANSSIVDTTITGNSAIAETGTAHGGGLDLGSPTSGITEALANDTIFANSIRSGSGSGDGGGLEAYQNTDVVQLSDTLVAGNTDDSGNAPDCFVYGGGAIASGGYNLIGDDTGCSFANATGDQVGTSSAPIDPLLGALANNGGKTQTMALLAGSPAVDAGNPAGCTDASGATLTRDQRNYPRPTDGNGNGTAVCDIGAYERPAETAPTASNGSITVTAGSSASGTLSGSAANGNPLTFSIVSNPSHGTVTITDTATGAFTYKPTKGYSGSDSFTFNDNDSYLNSNTATETATIKSAPSSGSGGGGGGGFGPFALFGLLVLALVPWWLRRHRPIAAGTAAPAWEDLPMKRVFRLQFLAAACAALIFGGALAAVPAYAAPGDVDTTFNSGVPVIEDDNAEGVALKAEAAAVSPLNSDILWVGSATIGGNLGTIYAYKPDGSPDTAFGAGGFQGFLQLTPAQAGVSGSAQLTLFGLAVDSQGRIVATGIVQGSSNNYMVLARFAPDGSLDTSFGTAGTGIVTETINTSALGSSVVLTADGHILVAGDSADAGVTEARLTVWRFNADGTLDTTYGTNGYVQLSSIADSGLRICLAALQPDGSILAGFTHTAGGSWKLTRLNTDGSVDSGFGASGFVTGASGTFLTGLALAPDGGFILSYGDTATSPANIYLRRFLADGTVDSSFNSGSLGGLYGPGPGEVPVMVQPDGKILVAFNGTMYTTSNSLQILRMLPDGSTDNSFGNAPSGSPFNITTVDLGSINGQSYTPDATALEMQGDGKIVASGIADSSAGSAAASFVTRVDNDSFTLTPAAFSFMNQTGVNRSTLITSNVITVSGLSSGVSVPVSVSGGEYKINSGAWTSAPGFVQDGDQVAVRQTSSSNYGTQTTTTLSIGGEAIPDNDSTVLGTPVTASFSSTTKSAPASGGGGGGGFGLFALLGLLLLALVPWWLRRHRPIAAETSAPAREDLPMKRIFRLHLHAAACAALIFGGMLAAVPAYAAPGDVDTTFNGGVPAVIDPGTGNSYDVLAGAIDPSNGDILWAGNYNVASGAIAAYKSDGTPDTVFGGVGEVILTAGAVGFSGGIMQLNGIAADGQGRILLTGIAVNSGGTTGGMLLIRLNPDGSLDTSFGAAGTGYVISPLTQSEGQGLSLTADGHILVTGYTYDSGSSQSELAVWRFSADGTLDNSFGTSGYVQISAIKDGSYLKCIPALQPNGTFLVDCYQGSANNWTAIHLMPDGSMDTGFGSSGFVTSTAGMEIFGLALVPDNGFVIGEADANTPPPTDLRRFLADGSVDTSFNSGNPFDLSTLMGTTTRLPVGAQADGKALVSGNDGATTLNVVRLLNNGTLDSGFGTNGVGTVDFSNIGGSGYESEPSAVLIQGDGKIVVLGYAVNNTDSRRISFVTRLDNDAFGFTPTAFTFTDKTGVNRSTLITSNTISVSGLSSGVSVPVSVSGGEYKINSGAWTSTPGFTQNGDQIAVRHTSSSSFSTQTTTTLTVGGQAIPNNNATVLGSTTSATFTSTTKAKSTGGGGGGGFGWLALLGLLILALVPWWLHRHRPIAAGTTAPARGNTPMKRIFRLQNLVAACAALVFGGVLAAVPAYAAPGDVDTTFNGGVPVIIDLNPAASVVASASAVNPLNGDILWAGFRSPSTGGAVGIVTVYKSDGTLDTTVGGGTGEIALTADLAGYTGGSLVFYDVAVDGQGRILATGYVQNSSRTLTGMVLARFKPNGTLDTGFGTAGTGAVIDALNTSAEGTGLSVTPGGYILVTGGAVDAGVTESELTVWRFKPDGTPDTNFGANDHVQITSVAGAGNLGRCFPALQPDGDLIVGCLLGGGPWLMTRLNPDGSVDDTFGTSGLVTSAAGMILLGLALAPDGGVVISEMDISSSPPPVDLHRFLSDGTVDSGFNSGNPLNIGTMAGPINSYIPVAVQPDGKILVSDNGGGNILNIVRLLASGAYDGSFGSGGIASIDFTNIGGYNYTPDAKALLMQGDGKIVAAGFADSTAGIEEASFVTRLDNDAFNFTPAAFSFMNQTGVGLSTLVTSNAISVSGLSSGVSVPVSVGGGEYQINSGAWTSAPGFTQNGDQIAVRHTSSGSYSTQTTTTLTIGGQAIPNNDSTVLGTPVSASFSSTTKSAPASGGGGGGGGSLGGFAVLALLAFAFVPWWLRYKHHRFKK